MPFFSYRGASATCQQQQHLKEGSTNGAANRSLPLLQHCTLQNQIFLLFFLFFIVNLILNLVCTLRLCTRDTSSKIMSLENEARAKSELAVSPFCVLYIIKYSSRILFILVFLYRTEKPEAPARKSSAVSLYFHHRSLVYLSQQYWQLQGHSHVHLRKGYWTLCYQLSL